MITSQKRKFLLYGSQDYIFDILRPLQEFAWQQGHEVKWFLPRPTVSRDKLKAHEHCLDSVTDVMRYCPDAVFVPTDKVPGFFPGLKVQVFHGLNEDKRGNQYPERGLFDLFCTEGPIRTGMLQPLAQKRGYFRVVETGWLKLDTLFNCAPPARTETRPQVLFASTFTPRLSSAEALYSEIRRLSQNSRWRWLVTLHPKMAPTTVAKYRQLENDNLSFFDTSHVIELLHRADLMVSDNSSVLQEFLLLNKPVVTFNNRDPKDFLINITQPPQLESAIEQALHPTPELLAAIAKYGPSVTSFLDGGSAQRVLAATEAMLNQGWQDKKPKNIWRNFKMRRELKDQWG